MSISASKSWKKEKSEMPLFFSGFANFYSCLGANNINNCLGMFGMIGMGNAPPLAFAYEGLLSDWGFKCGVGFFGIFIFSNMLLTFDG